MDAGGDGVDANRVLEATADPSPSVGMTVLFTSDWPRMGCFDRAELLALDAGGAAFGEGADLVERGHGGVAGKSGEECAVGPS